MYPKIIFHEKWLNIYLYLYIYMYINMWNMVKWASIKTSTKVRGYVPSAKILGGKTTLNIKWPKMSVFDQKFQFLTKNDNFLIKYAYFLKNKTTKRRGGVPSAEIQNWKTTFFKINVPKSNFQKKWLKLMIFSRICLKRSGRGRRRRRRKNFPRASKSRPPRTQGQHIP